MVDTIDGNTETDTVQAVSPGRVQTSRHSGLLRAGRLGCRNRYGQRRQCQPSPSLDAPTQRLPIGTPTQAAEKSPAFIPVPLAPKSPELPGIRIEIRRGTAALKIDWPVSAAGDCAVWLRDWLR